MLKASSNSNSVNQVSSEFLKKRGCTADRCCVLFGEEEKKKEEEEFCLEVTQTWHQRQKLNIHQSFLMAAASGLRGGLVSEG